MSAIVGIIHYHDEPIQREDSEGIMADLSKFPAENMQSWQEFWDATYNGSHRNE
ncbi:hypothetical protein [Siminovitchia acidinfaciens]|nr:hypothetical protein [Siminovitchia acidinfaciens]